jgi:mono/diheme cytochrome c family protein
MGLRARAFALLDLVFALALVGCDKAPPVAQATPWTAADHERLPGEEEPSGAPRRVATLAEQVWGQRCVACHGANGQGTGMAAVPNFASAAWQASRKDDELVASIVNGRGAMPKFDLPEGTVKELVAAIRSLAR